MFARGSEFLYVREDIQGSAVKDLSYPGYVHFNYAPWVGLRNPTADEFPYDRPKGAERYEADNVSCVAYAGQYEALKRIQALGVDKM